jgi:hypothetical protein
LNIPRESSVCISVARNGHHRLIVGESSWQ